MVWRIGLCIGGLTLFWTMGCGSARESEEREQSNLKPLAVLYGQFTGQHRGQPPENEAQFREFVRTQGPAALASFGITDPESIFVSSRDGEPYVIRYGADQAGPPGTSEPRVVAYEKTGVGGKRFVANALGAIEEVDEARFKELVPDASP
jgi:hypothetical protein